jgi:GTP pyrophosphokinase
MNRLYEALRLMQRSHAGQKRKDGRPYWTHPLAVYDVLSIELRVRDDDAKIAALLHDVVEDTPVQLAEIETRFGAMVAQMVGALTKPPLAPGQTKEEMLESYYAGLRSAPDVVRQIKIADRVHNLRDMVSTDRSFQEKYLPDSRELLAVLAQTPGIELLYAEYAAAESRLLHLLTGREFRRRAYSPQ